MRAEGLPVSSDWVNGPGEVYAAHSHPYHKVLFVAEGTIVFTLPFDPAQGDRQGRTVRLREGDRLDLPPGTVHSAVVGPEGVTCLEAHL